MPLRCGEICEGCRKHIHPQTQASKSSHPLPACDLCLPPGHILRVCGGCKLTRYCGKACQKGHRPAHKEACEGNIWINEWAKAYGPEMEARQASFARWCENNSQAFVRGAFGALEISSPLDRQKAYEYVFFIVVETENVASDRSNKQSFAHSIFLASKQSRQAMHDKHDKPMAIFYKETGGPGAVEKFLLPSSGSIIRVVFQNIDLLPPLNLYTLTFIIDEESLYNTYNPNWLEHLKKNVTL